MSSKTITRCSVPISTPRQTNFKTITKTCHSGWKTVNWIWWSSSTCSWRGSTPLPSTPSGWIKTCVPMAWFRLFRVPTASWIPSRPTATSFHSATSKRKPTTLWLFLETRTPRISLCWNPIPSITRNIKSRWRTCCPSSRLIRPSREKPPRRTLSGSLAPSCGWKIFLSPLTTLQKTIFSAERPFRIIKANISTYMRNFAVKPKRKGKPSTTMWFLKSNLSNKLKSMLITSWCWWRPTSRRRVPKKVRKSAPASHGPWTPVPACATRKTSLNSLWTLFP